MLHILASSDFIILAIKISIFRNIALNSRKGRKRQLNLHGMSDTGRPLKIIINKEIEVRRYENIFLLKSSWLMAGQGLKFSLQSQPWAFFVMP